MKDFSELLLVNAHSLTMDPGRPAASVLAIRGPELTYVGDDPAEAARTLSPGAVKRDLAGLTVIPGLTDGHSHIISEGIRLIRLNVSRLSKDEALAAVRREAGQRPAGEWIVGYGWNQEDWPEGGWPDKADLDAAAPDHPVCLDRIDRHSLWANSRALAEAGLRDGQPDPPGGEFLKDADGRLRGILIGQAMFAVWDCIPPLGESGSYQALLRGQAEMFGFGLTSLVVAGVTGPDLALMKKAYQAGDLKIRIRAMLLAHGGHDEAYLAAGGRRELGLFGERLSVAGVKIHSDGSLGSRSAWLLEDYADRPGHRGGRTYDDQALEAIMERARVHGLQVSVHAIGDAAVRQAVETMARVIKRHPGDHRWRIEHFQVVTERDLALALDVGIVPSLQTVGIMNDLDMAEDRLGPEVIKRAYNWRDLLSRGGRFVNGSDGPIETVNPFEGMYAAVTRQNLAGRPAGGWFPRHRLSRREALASYTSWSAWAEFNEHRKGLLKTGYAADLAVLDRDPLTCPETEIKDIQTLLTIVAGETVFDRGVG